jgi:KaiC/GvpD/RAD55 family RecA-like ATPase
MSAPDSRAAVTSQVQPEVEKLLGVDGLLNPAVKAISIKGPPGAGKTTLAFELIKAAHGGMYVSTRATEALLAKQYRPFASLIEKGEVVIYQPPTGQKAKVGTIEYEQVRQGKQISDMAQKVAEIANDRNKPLIILDSWNSFTRELDDKDLARAEYDLLTSIEKSQQKIIFVSEGLELTTVDYLVDAIVALHDNEHEGRRVRRIEWIKLRGKEIPQKRHLFTLANGEFRTLPKTQEPFTPTNFAAQKFKPTPHSTEKYSTGSRDFDTFLGGLGKGGVVLLEFGRTISSRIHLPLTTVIRCNFLAQGGCSVTIPSGEVPPERIRQDAYPYLDKQAVESGLGVAHFETTPADPWFIKLYGKSFENDQQIFWQKANELKAGLDKPCFIYMGIDTIEYTYEDLDIMGPLMTAIQNVREYRDVMMFGVKPGSQVKQKLSDVSDLHMKIDEVEGASILYLVKPPSGLMHLAYDFSLGYPMVKLTAIV